MRRRARSGSPARRSGERHAPPAATRTGPRAQAPLVARPSRVRAEAQRGGRLLMALFALLALAVGIVVVVVATAPPPTKVVLRNVVYTDVQQASSALKQLVSENTK